MKRFYGVGMGVLFVVGVVGHASAATLKVANNGTDSGSCGPSGTPCRSISQAITNAAAGDTIRVGPGLYGDLNNDGTLSGAGEEVSGDATKMILVNKKLTILSTDGAAATTLWNSSCSGPPTYVSIETSGASGVKFGAKGKGFTFGYNGCSGFMGISVDGSTTGVTVAGNRFNVYGTAGIVNGTGHTVMSNIITGWSSTPAGLLVGGSNHVVKNNIGENGTLGTAPGSSKITLKNNQMLGLWTANGFDLQGSGHVLLANVASGLSAGGCPNGFLCHGDCGNSGGLTFIANIAQGACTNGFEFESGTGHVLTGNFGGNETNAGFRFAAAMTVTLKGNEATGNGYGLDMAAGVVPTVTKNAFIGNSYNGIWTNSAAGSITKNDIYGNDQAGANCGIYLATSGTLAAQNNYWGAASGPGSDPADLACNGSGTIDASSPSAVPFPVSVPRFP